MNLSKLLKLLKNKKYLIIIAFIIFTLIVIYLNKQTQYEYFETVSSNYKQSIKTINLGLNDTDEKEVNNTDEKEVNDTDEEEVNDTDEEEVNDTDEKEVNDTDEKEGEKINRRRGRRRGRGRRRRRSQGKKQKKQEKEIHMINNIKLTVYIRNDDGSIFSRESSIVNNQITVIFNDCKYTIDRLDHIKIKVNYPNQNNNEIQPFLNVLSVNDCNDKQIVNYDLVSLVRREDYSLNIKNYYMYNPAMYSSDDEFIKQLEDCEKNNGNYKIIKKFSFKNDLPPPSNCKNKNNHNNNENKETNVEKPDCYYTPYGCCRDGYTISDDLMGTNCKPLNCATSTFGCCRDGITPSLDLYGTNCPPRNRQN